MVCGLFFRLRRKGGKGGRGSGSQGKGRKRKPEALIELRGAARRQQISRGVEEASRAEGEGDREWSFDFGEGAQYPHPVPY